MIVLLLIFDVLLSETCTHCSKLLECSRAEFIPHLLLNGSFCSIASGVNSLLKS